MGFSLSWLAIRGKPAVRLFDELGIRGTGTFEEIFESPLTGATLPGGWYLLISNHDGPDLLNDQILKRLSSGCDVVSCFIEEHVMCSAASGWKDGREVWSILHVSAEGIEHLEARGDLPAMFVPIRDRLRSQQEAAGGRDSDVDHIFDVPVEVAREVTGFRHDQGITGAVGNQFEVLVNQSNIKEKKSWLTRWFGSRKR
jgi:hypothetical protein